jgi:hypothetical protein
MDWFAKNIREEGGSFNAHGWGQLHSQWYAGRNSLEEIWKENTTQQSKRE